VNLAFGREARDSRSGLLSRQREDAPTPVPARFIPDTAPDEPGFVGPVGVPPDPPALLAPKPTFGVKPGLTSGIDVIGLAPPNWAYCAKAVVLVATSIKAESNIKCLLRMTAPFLLTDAPGPSDIRRVPTLPNRSSANTDKQFFILNMSDRAMWHLPRVAQTGAILRLNGRCA
jgi:hypothetical protein